MKVVVDRARCEGHGLCVDAAPQLFQLDQEGELVERYPNQEIPADQETHARNAIRVCPIAALAADS